MFFFLTLNSARLYAPSISINALKEPEEPVFYSSIWKDAISKQVLLLLSPILSTSLSLSLSLLLSFAKHDDVQYWSLSLP